MRLLFHYVFLHRYGINPEIPKSRDPGHFSNPEIPGLSSPNPGIFGIKLCRISALFSPHLAPLANPFDR